MGKQVQFYMTHEDEKNFLASINRLAPVRLIYQMFSDPSQMELKSVSPVAGGDIVKINLCLVKTTLVAPLKIHSYPRQPNQIDKLESEVVEFHRCELFKTMLIDGRLWFAEQTMHVKKSETFVKWANSLLKWVRSNYERDARGIYVAPNALKLSKAGKLQLGPSSEPELSSEERKRIFGLR